MNTNEQIIDLWREAYAAAVREQHRHAALLYERARALATDASDHKRAFRLGVDAVVALDRQGKQKTLDGISRSCSTSSRSIPKAPTPKIFTGPSPPIFIIFLQHEANLALTSLSGAPRN